MPVNGWNAAGNGYVINGVTFFAGAGVPDNALGANGDFYFRSDGTVIATMLYHKAAGIWVGAGI